MSKGLEALKNIKREKPTFFSAIYDGDMWEEDIETIEKELKELEERREMMKRFNEACVPMVLDNRTEKALKENEQYKEIEEELGIDLVTLFKALKNGIYGKIGNKNEHILAPHLSWHYREIYIFKIKDYGKTWALTKEKLL